MESVRKFFVGGNWKSNGTMEFTNTHMTNVMNTLTYDSTKCDVLIAPTNLHLGTVKALVKNDVLVSAQNVSLTEEGAFTGEVTAKMLKDFGITWTLTGHSERRSLFGETSDIVGRKTKMALDKGLSVVACIGESLAEREAGKTLDVCYEQLTAISANVTDWSRVVIAYEPVWAIGTGKTPTVEDAQSVHLAIRNWIRTNASQDAGNGVRILYGGSVTDVNCNAFAAQADIDGFLVGGASLKPGFKAIVESYKIKHK